RPLPAVTTFVITVSRFLQAHWPMIVALIVAAIAGYKFANRTGPEDRLSTAPNFDFRFSGTLFEKLQSRGFRARSEHLSPAAFRFCKRSISLARPPLATWSSRAPSGRCTRA